MKFSYSSLTLTAGLLLQSTSVLAHGYVQDLKIGNDWYVGSLPFSDQWKQPPAQRVTWPFYANGNGPVVDVTKHDIVCNTITTPGALDAPIAAGQQVTFYWTDWPSGHKGPVMTYLGYCGENTPCSSIQDPASLSYFKIDHKGYDKANGRWAAEELIANNNSWTVTIPSDIKAGYYLIRHEILALQEAAVPVSGQFYPSCSNLKVTGGGSALPQGVKFPGAYSNEDPGIHINIYTGFNGDYVIPGPDVYGGGGSGSNSNSGNNVDNDDNYDTGSSSGENANEGEQPVVETSAAPESSPLSTQSAVSSPVSSSQAPPPPPPPPTNEKHDSAAVYEEGSKVGTFVTSFVDYVPSPTLSSVPPPPSSSSSSAPPPPPPPSSTQAPVSTFSYRHKHHAHSSVVQQQPPKPENNEPVIETVVVTTTSPGPEAPKAPENPPKQENNGGTIIETVVVTATSPSEPKPSPDTPQQQENPPPQQENNGPVYETVVVTVTSSSAGPKVTEVVHEEPAPQPNKDQDENAHWVIETVYAPSVVVTVEVTKTEVVVATAYA